MPGDDDNASPQELPVIKVSGDISQEEAQAREFDTSLVRDAQSFSDVTGKDRLAFAREILIGLFFIVLLVFSMSFIQPENKALEKIFEWVKVGVLPLVTLVIGFYFPNSSRDK